MTIGTILFLVGSGVAAGLLGSLLGLGGGILIIPILVLALKVPMHTAIATSLLCVIATSSAAASRNVRRGIANIHLGVTLEIGTVLGAMIGSAVAGLLPGTTLMLIFGIAMCLMSAPMMRGVGDQPVAAEEGDPEATEEPSRFANALRGSFYDHATNSEVSYIVRRLPLAVSISGFAGILSGLLGVGGGIITVPTLATFCDVPIKAAAATSNFIIGVTALASAIIYYGRGDVSPLISAASVVGVFLGSRIGTVVATRVHQRSLRRAFAVIMVLIGAQLILRSTGVMEF